MIPRHLIAVTILAVAMMIAGSSRPATADGECDVCEGLNALVRELRKLPPSAVCERMTSIDRLVETWSPPDCDRLTFRKQLSDILAPLADLRPLAGTAPAEDPDGGSARAKRTSAPQTGTRIRNCC